jgi:hypothetical protein
MAGTSHVGRIATQFPLPARRLVASLAAAAMVYAVAACGHGSMTSSWVGAVGPSAGASASAVARPSADPSGRPAPQPSRTGSTAGIVNTSLPLRAAFYYPWYPENFANNGTHYLPTAGHYNGDDPSVVDRQIGDMQYAGLQAGISSWWGRGQREDRRFALLLAEATKLHFSWSIYYEPEGQGDPSSATITSDLAYLRRYTSSSAFLHVGGKAVVFVYADGNDGCGMNDRWASADTSGFYVVLKVFGGYRGCAHQPSGWHQYAPGGDIDLQSGYSAVVSPGFWRNDVATPQLARDPDRFRRDATTVATSGAPFQLVTTFNEWGEGTSIESTTAWPSADGHGVYVDILHDVFGAHPR